MEKYLLRPIPFLLAALLLPASLFAAGLKPQPSGLYDLLSAAPLGGTTDLTGNPCLTNPNVDGYRYRTGWLNIQPTDSDTYNWVPLDAAIAIAAQNGKQVGISIAAGFYTPDWVYTSDPVVYKYVMLETDPATGLSVGNQPLPWDTAFQAKWKKFVTAFGARYDGNPAVSYIILTGFMESNPMTLAGTAPDEAAMNALAASPPAGYTGLTTIYTDANVAYIGAAQAAVTEFVNDFATTPLVLTLQHVFQSPAGQTDQNSMAAWGLATYPDRFGTMVAALYAVPAPHAPGPVPPLPPVKGFQLVSPASEAARLYLNPDPDPIPPAPTPLQDALEHGITLGGKFIEVYEGDLTAPESQPILVLDRAGLKSNVPPTGIPGPPTNLRIGP